MSHMRKEGFKSSAPLVALAATLLAVAVTLSLTTAATGRVLAPAMEVTQTCSGRVEPGASIQIQATVMNNGDTTLQVTQIDGDAGTPENTGDDFTPTYSSGDTNGNQVVDPNEDWVYVGSFTAPDEDVTNNVGVDAVAPDGTQLSDVAPCETDVRQTPMPGVIVGVRLVSGKVLVKKPGTGEFIELEGTTEIPVGSQVNTLQGTIALTAGLGGGRTNTSQFNGGLFTILQQRVRNAFTTLRIDGGNFRICRSGRALSVDSIAARRKRPVRRLFGSGKGRFTTRGRYSSATVRGTRWLVIDRCDGTLTRVLQGVVRVRDFRLRKNVKVRAGRSYLAKAPGR